MATLFGLIQLNMLKLISNCSAAVRKGRWLHFIHLPGLKSSNIRSARAVRSTRPRSTSWCPATSRSTRTRTRRPRRAVVARGEGAWGQAPTPPFLFQVFSKKCFCYCSDSYTCVTLHTVVKMEYFGYKGGRRGTLFVVHKVAHVLKNCIFISKNHIPSTKKLLLVYDFKLLQ